MSSGVISMLSLRPVVVFCLALDVVSGGPAVTLLFYARRGLHLYRRLFRPPEVKVTQFTAAERGANLDVRCWIM